MQLRTLYGAFGLLIGYYFAIQLNVSELLRPEPDETRPIICHKMCKKVSDYHGLVVLN